MMATRQLRQLDDDRVILSLVDAVGTEDEDLEDRNEQAIVHLVAYLTQS